MSTNFNVKGTITAIVSAGSLRMLGKLQQELSKTAQQLYKMGDTAAANAVGHMGLALGTVVAGAEKAAGGVKKLATNVAGAAQTVGALTKASEKQKLITEQLASEWKYSSSELGALNKAVGMLGKEFTYGANAQRAWVPALRASLIEINKQKAAMVASGKAIAAHVTGQELFDRTTRNLAQGLKGARSGLTDYDKALEKSLGRSPAFREALGGISKAVGVQGQSFKNQAANLVRVDDVWRNHVTTLHKAGTVTTQQANKMYDSYKHLGLSVSELKARIKASNGELLNAATYNRNARAELSAHTKAMKDLNTAEEKLAAVSGKSVQAVQAGTAALVKQTGSISGAVAGIKKQTEAYKNLARDQAEVAKKEKLLATATGARLSKIHEITRRMVAQGRSYEQVGAHLDALNKKYAKTAPLTGKVSKASDELRRSNSKLANEIDALGRVKVRNIATTEASAKSIEYLRRKYPLLGKEVTVLTQKMATTGMSVATADVLLNQMRLTAGKTAVQASLLSRAMSSLVVHMKSFAAYAAAATIISAVAASFGYAISTVVKYDQALHDLKAITQATDREVGLMDEKIREIGRTTKFSAMEVASAMRTLGQAGFTATEAIETIGSVAALAAGTLSNIGTTVDLITTAITAFDMEASEASKVTDIFANAVNRSKLDIDKLRIAFNYLGPIAAEAGIGLDEIAAATMELANAGIRASTIGTGTRRAIQQLIEPTKEFKAALEAAGYTTEDFNTQTNDLRDIIRRLSIVVPDAEAAFKMFALRSASVITTLASGGVAAFDALLSATHRTGSALEMQATQLEGLGLIYKQVMNKATDLAISFGKLGVTGALEVLGKVLQWTLDRLSELVNSGFFKVIASVAAVTAGLYVLKFAFEALKIELIAAKFMELAIEISAVRSASDALLLVQTALRTKFVELIAVAGILYLAYKLLSSVVEKNVEVNLDWITTAEKARTEERKRLEGVRDLVTLIRDETASDSAHTNALKDLQEKMGDLGLEIDKNTGLVSNYSEVLSKNREEFNKLEGAVEEFDKSSKVTGLLETIQAHEEINEALDKQRKLLDYTKEGAAEYSKSQEGFFGTVETWAKRIITPMSEIVRHMRFSDNAVKDREKGYKSLTEKAEEAYKKMSLAVLDYSQMTQEIWVDEMRKAGASTEVIEKLVTDSKAVITAEHLEMYLRIQAGRDGLTRKEERGIKESIRLYSKLANTKEAILSREITVLRAATTERLRLVSESYDAEIQELKRMPDLSGKTYDTILKVIVAKEKKKLAILQEGYEKEKRLILDSEGSNKKKQEDLLDLDETTANRRKMIEAEAHQTSVDAVEAHLSRIEEAYKRGTDVYNEQVGRRKDAVNSFYDFEVAKAEAQLENRRALGESVVSLERDRLREIGELGDQLVDLEKARYDEVMAIEEASLSARLMSEKLFHMKQVGEVTKALSAARELYEKDKDKLTEMEEDLNGKLVEIDKASAEERYGILKEWSDELGTRYDEAVEKAREYALAVIDLEHDIQEIRKETAKQLVESAETTRELRLKISQAGMTDAQAAASEYAELCRKRKEADDLMSTGIAENIEKAIALYEEYQKGIADLGVEAAKAHKEEIEGLKKAQELLDKANKLAAAGQGKEAKKAYEEWKKYVEEMKKEKVKVPIDVAPAKKEVEAIGEVIEAARKKAEELAVTAKNKEIEVAQERSNQWQAVATLLDNRFKEIGITLDNIIRDRSMTIHVYYVEHNKPSEVGGKANGGIVEKAEGGTIPGTGTGDTVPAMLTPGEFVVKKSSVDKYGSSFLAALNAGLVRAGDFLKYEVGGLVGKGDRLLEVPVDTSNLRKMISAVTSLADKMVHIPEQRQGVKQEEPLVGRYEFVLNIGSAVLSGRATKGVLDRFQSELRRQELVRGLPA
jgi:TP901 family phage tail tape measure protein